MIWAIILEKKDFKLRYFTFFKRMDIKFDAA